MSADEVARPYGPRERQWRLRWLVELDEIHPPGIIVGKPWGVGAISGSGDTPDEAFKALQEYVARNARDAATQLAVLAAGRRSE